MGVRSVVPPARSIRTSVDAEEVAAEWMRYWGYHDAERTGGGADGGIGRRVWPCRCSGQGLRGAGWTSGPPAVGWRGSRPRDAVLCAGRALPWEAVEWAYLAGMALFRFDLQGIPEPCNELGLAIVERGPGFAGPLMRYVAPKYSDQQALAMINRMNGRWRRKEIHVSTPRGSSFMC